MTEGKRVVCLGVVVAEVVEPRTLLSGNPEDGNKHVVYAQSDCSEFGEDGVLTND